MPRDCGVRRMAVTTTRKLPLFEQFFAVRRFSSALAFTVDTAQLLFVSNISGQFNLWRVSVDGGWPDQLTAFTEETVRGLAVSPIDGRLVLSADHDGDEFHQLYLLDPDGGWPEQITNEPEVQHLLSRDAWSPDGTAFAYAANARKPTDMETWIRDAATGETRPVFGEGMFSFPGPWSADGSGFYLATDEGSEFRGLAFYDLAAGRFDWVEEPRHDVQDVTASADGRVL